LKQQVNMTSLTQFVFNSQQVRIISVNGDPWFVASDVCKILDVTNVSKALSRLDDEEIMSLDRESILTLSDDPNTVRLSAISESGLYSLTLGSRKPQAKDFKRWVTREILPTIRKTGKYEIAPSQPALPQNYIEALEAHLQSEKDKKVLAEANQKLIAANQSLEIEVQTLEPKADRYDLILATDGWMTGEEIVKQLNIPKFSVRKLYDILRKEKVLFKRPSDGTNLPYASWQNEGLATIRDGQCFDGRMRFSPAFSWKGLDRILDLLRKHQVIPKDKQYRFNFDSDKIVAMKRA
jgi:prophage antirepressor-like protein